MLPRDVLRQLTSDELLDLCLDHFPEVYRQFTDGQSQSQRVRLLIDFVRRRRETQKLSRLIKDVYQPAPARPETQQSGDAGSVTTRDAPPAQASQQTPSASIPPSDISNDAIAVGLVSSAEKRLDQGRPEEALPFLNSAKRHLGDDGDRSRPVYSAIIHNLGRVHESQGDFIRAQEFYSEALGLRNRLLGQDDPATGASAERLAAVGMLVVGDDSTVSEQSERHSIGPLLNYSQCEIRVTATESGIDVYIRDDEGRDDTASHQGDLPRLEFPSTGNGSEVRQWSENRESKEEQEQPIRVADAGEALSDILLKPKIEALLRGCLERHQDRDLRNGVRIGLRVPDTMSHLPWEAIRYNDDFLSLSVLTPIVRQPVSPTAVRDLPHLQSLRILVVTSNPTNVEAVNVAGERAALEEQLAASLESHAVQMTWLQRAENESLKQALARAVKQQYDVLHYIGHASYDEKNNRGLLCFEDKNGAPDDCTARELAKFVADSMSIRMVFLNACQTGLGGGRASFADELVRRQVLAVLAHRRPVRNEIATRFASYFYDAVVNWEFPVDAAFVKAREEVYYALDDPDLQADWVDPILFSRAKDMRLFEFANV